MSASSVTASGPTSARVVRGASLPGCPTTRPPDRSTACSPPPRRWSGSMPGTSVARRGGARGRRSSARATGSRTCPSCPRRGPGADLVGRTAGLLASVAPDLAVETTPAGWRFADAPGREMRRARSWLGEDLDALEEALAGLRRARRRVAGRALDPGGRRRAARRRARRARRGRVPRPRRRRWRTRPPTTSPTLRRRVPGAPVVAVARRAGAARRCCAAASRRRAVAGRLRRDRGAGRRGRAARGRRRRARGRGARRSCTAARRGRRTTCSRACGRRRGLGRPAAARPARRRRGRRAARVGRAGSWPASCPDGATSRCRTCALASRSCAISDTASATARRRSPRGCSSRRRAAWPALGPPSARRAVAGRTSAPTGRGLREEEGTAWRSGTDPRGALARARRARSRTPGARYYVDDAADAVRRRVRRALPRARGARGARTPSW